MFIKLMDPPPPKKKAFFLQRWVYKPALFPGKKPFYGFTNIKKRAGKNPFPFTKKGFFPKIKPTLHLNLKPPPIPHPSPLFLNYKPKTKIEKNQEKGQKIFFKNFCLIFFCFFFAWLGKFFFFFFFGVCLVLVFWAFWKKILKIFFFFKTNKN